MGVQLLNVKEAAGRLGVSPWTLYAWVSKGKIGHVKVGRRTMFTPENLEDFVKPVPARKAA